jgi:hypothetical protein
MASNPLTRPPHRSTPARAAEDLLAHAIDRQDIKWCLARIDTELQIEK